MSAFEERAGFAPGSQEEVERKLAKGEVAWVVLSGKICSGKDTVARRLQLPGDKEKLSYGDILRENLSLVMDYAFTWEGRSFAEIVADVKAILGYSQEASEAFVEYTSARVLKEGALNPYERTDYMRTLLQNMGSIWLPNQDYLRVAASHRACLIFSRGDSVVAAGSRFLPDVEIPRLAGGFTVRLDVTRETQLRRLKERDGLEATPDLLKSLEHPGEVALDDFTHDIRVSNDVAGEEAFEELVEDINARIAKILRERKASS